MKTKLLVLLVAALGLAGCETAKVTGHDAGSGKRVVRMAPIPDETSAPRATDKVARVAASSGATAAATTKKPAARTATATRARTTGAAAAAAAATAATPAPATSDSTAAATAATETPSVTPDATAGPPADVVAGEGSTVAAGPAATSQPGSSLMTALSGLDPAALMQARVAGMPMWLVGLVGIVLLGTLGFAMRGARKTVQEEI